MSLLQEIKNLWLSGDLNNSQYMEIYSQTYSDPKKGKEALNRALDTNRKLKHITRIEL